VYAASVEKMVEIRYAGVTVARSSAVRELDTKGLFLGLTEPLPSGTDVSLKVGDEEIPCRVTTVVESADISKAGMRVAFRVPGKASVFGAAADVGEPEPLAPRVVSPAREASSPTEAVVSPGSGGIPNSAPISTSGATVSGAVRARDASAPEAPLSGHSSGRRIVIDASSEKPVPDKLAAAATETNPESKAPAAPAAEIEPESSKKQKKSKRR
jgi:hypothetical protein